MFKAIIDFITGEKPELEQGRKRRAAKYKSQMYNRPTVYNSDYGSKAFDPKYANGKVEK